MLKYIILGVLFLSTTTSSFYLLPQLNYPERKNTLRIPYNTKHYFEKNSRIDSIGKSQNSTKYIISVQDEGYSTKDNNKFSVLTSEEITPKSYVIICEYQNTD